MANLSNWRVYPHNQWSFINVDKVLKTRTIQRSTTPHPLPSAPLPLETSFHIRVDNDILDLSAYIKTSSTDGLIVLKQGKIVYEKYANGGSATSKNIMMSVTKSVMGLLAGILVDRGELDPADLVTKHVPEVSQAFRNVMIRQLLDMRSGVVYNDNDPVYQYAAGWKRYEGKPFRNVRDFLSKFGPERVEDERFEFTGVNTEILGWVMERAIGHGKTIAQLLQELFWQPMGAESDALMTIDESGNTRAASGLCATLRDIARVGQLVADGGRGIVSREWLRDMTKGDKEAFAKSKWPELCMLFVDPVNDIVVARSGSQSKPLDYGKIHLTFVAWKEIRRVLLSQNLGAPRESRL
ncbi:hypothetical protein M409DRAFT_64897 [Zasmidium cellare ATCC 36951]|uniref:Beta-lactamase-related domain-containing protein n=1 Tax=Zasmidium cellare ATCC 36951 TaxID=1080233 RepID=A0A6A6CR12_ZASCE|nr:uncharacterized protein M409DRAFT_64897 [Zasmidium cellare ATCC 36951]KAF2169123.1 hypothetical protein M409DRAFT_64897 [Zasmidium cellare ATCC 36951]